MLFQLLFANLTDISVPGADSTNFASELLRSVNECRKRHGAEALILNPTVSEKAEKWAAHLVKSRTLKHSDTQLGENIWCQQGSVSRPVTGMISQAENKLLEQINGPGRVRGGKWT